MKINCCRVIILTIALIATILLAAVTVVGCNNRDTQARNELRYGFTTEPVTFDPLSPANTADGRSILFNVFEGLVKPDSEGSLLPAVAESYTVDGLVYTFTVREGERFHDGSEVKSSDVVFSLRTAASAGFPGLDKIASVEVSGAREVRITLTASDVDFLPYLTVGIVPESNADRERNPIGTGPFMIEHYAPQQSLSLVRNPFYRISNIPALDRVTIVFVAGSDAIVTALRGGNIDSASVTGAMLTQLNPNDFDIIPWFSNTTQLVALNNARAPLDDVRVRLAINYAIDVPEVIQSAFHGHGAPSGSPLIPGLVNAFDETLRDPFPRNLETARQLLADAGLGGGFPLEITVPSNFTMHVDTAQVIVNQLAQVGISATIRLVDWPTWLAEVYRGKQYDATIISLDGNIVSPRAFLARYVSGAGGNFINFSSADFDRVFSAALAEPNEERRNALYKEAQRIISENAAGVFIQDILGFRVFPRGRFGGVVNFPLHVMDFSLMYKN